jgi:dipeptidyl aminopeptidase/acylaminoacyl peptidase
MTSPRAGRDGTVADETQPISIEDAITFRTPDDVQIAPDGAWAVFSLGWASKTGEHEVADLWLAALDGSQTRRLTSGDSHDIAPRWSPDGQTIAFISDGEKRGTGALFLIAPSGGEAVRLSGGDAALADPQWAPDGRRISVKVTDPETEDEKQRKEKRNDALVHDEADKFDRLCVVDVPAAPFGSAQLAPVEPRRLLDGDWHVWEHRWSPDGTRLAVRLAQRPGFGEMFDGLRAGLVPAGGGEITWIDSARRAYRNVSALAWSPDGRRLALLGAFDFQADSGDALFLVDPDQPQNVTLRFKDETGSPQGIGWRDDTTLVLLRLLSIYENLWTLDADGGEPQRAVAGPLGERGQISQFSTAGGRFACAWNDGTHPREVWGGALGGEARQLTHFNDALLTRAYGRTELLRWRADDGLEIEGLLIYPVGYQEGQRYPTILEIHGGPSGAWTDHLYGTWHDWAQLLAGRGYAVLLPNPRGGTGRGWQFQRANQHDWMGGDYRDSQAGLDALIERGIADPDRLGIGGWSYGGYTTTWAVSQTGRFKAAVAGAGTSNRTSAIGTTDLPRWAQTWFAGGFAENPDTYWQRSPVRYIGQATTPTLVLHGELDQRVPHSQGVEFYNQLRMHGVPAKMVTYPREPHVFREREHQRDLLERVLGWFDQWLRS